MELIAKILVVIGAIFALGISFLCALHFMRTHKTAAKQWIDLGSVLFGAASFVTAVFTVSGLLRLHEGSWLLDYPLIGKPSFFTFVLPLFLAVALGLSLAKKWCDLVEARKS